MSFALDVNILLYGERILAAWGCTTGNLLGASALNIVGDTTIIVQPSHGFQAFGFQLRNATTLLTGEVSPSSLRSGMRSDGSSGEANSHRRLQARRGSVSDCW